LPSRHGTEYACAYERGTPVDEAARSFLDRLSAEGMAIDNVLSHPEEAVPVLMLIRTEPRMVSAVVATGKGQLYATKTG
jgi:hypothetical protein